MEKNYTYEVCPHCNKEVQLDAELKVQTCPNCGRRIVTCSMCRATEFDGGYCTRCCLSYQAGVENDEADWLYKGHKIVLEDEEMIDDNGQFIGMGFRACVECPDGDVKTSGLVFAKEEDARIEAEDMIDEMVQDEGDDKAVVAEKVAEDTSKALRESEKPVRYRWFAFSDDRAFEDWSNESFATKKECYEDMRQAVLHKMTWNTEYDDDFNDPWVGDVVYSVRFAQERIIHSSFSGCYLYRIVKDGEKPTWKDFFNEETLKELKDLGLTHMSYLGILTDTKGLANCLKPGVSLYDLICHWTEDRGGEEYFALFDLENEKDFRLFYENHGFKTIEMMRQSRYWFDGLSLNEPEQVHEDRMVKFINTEVLDWIRERMKGGDDISHWDRFFRMDSLKALLQA